MIAFWILLALSAIVVFLLFLKIHFIFDYHDRASVTLKVLFFRFNAIALFQKSTKRNDGNEAKTSPDAASQKPKGKKSVDPVGFVSFLGHIAEVIGLAAKELFSKATVNLKELKVSVGTDDAAQTALLYGGAIQAANALCAILMRFSKFRCDNRNLRISPDFTSEKSKFSLHLVMTSRLVYILGVVLRTYFRFFERKEDNYARNSVKTGH